MGRSRKCENAAAEERKKRLLIMLLMIPLVAVIAAVVMVASGRFLPGKGENAAETPGTQAAETMSQSETEASVAPDNSEYNQYFEGSILEKDTVPEINQLMEAYFQAENNCDVDTLNSLFASGDTSMAEKQKRDLEFMKQYIEGYGNISCYTVQGPSDDFYIAYTYYETKYIHSDTWAPGLIHPYVRKMEDGSFKIYDGEMTEELTKFLDQTEVNEDVRLLAAEVDNRLAEALGADSQLNAMVEFVRRGPDYSEETE